MDVIQAVLKAMNFNIDFVLFEVRVLGTSGYAMLNIRITVPTDHLSLTSFVCGDELGRIFEFKIAPAESVSALKKVIKDKKRHACRDVDADRLDIWKVSDLIFILILTISYFQGRHQLGEAAADQWFTM